jgi:propanol-preferring alcohol dehydrogenase
VTANTRDDGHKFLKIAAEAQIKSSTIPMPLADANRALTMLKHDELAGAAVLRVSGD